MGKKKDETEVLADCIKKTAVCLFTSGSPRIIFNRFINNFYLCRKIKHQKKRIKEYAEVS